jgi:hypothetical protein
MGTFWRHPRSGAFLLLAAGAFPLYVEYGWPAVLLACACLSLGFTYGRSTCNDGDLNGHH